MHLSKYIHLCVYISKQMHCYIHTNKRKKILKNDDESKLLNKWDRFLKR